MEERGTPLAVTTQGAEETRALAATLGALVAPGDVILLRGDLGAGKTTFTQGLARGAGVTEVVNSPTFILVNEYRGRVRIYHADLYRLDDAREVAALELSGASLDGVLVVEWPERGHGLLPEEHLLVELRHRGPETRQIYFVPAGKRARTLCARLSAHLGLRQAHGGMTTDE